MLQTAQHKLNEFLETQLNDPQKTAVQHDAGSLLVIAGAGSGKTRVITARIAHLILHNNVHPSSIVALTFTNKAAKEMKERIAAFIGKQEHLPFVGTFHSYCLVLLKKYGHLLDMPFFSIMDGDDQQKMINGIIQRNNLSKQISARQAAYKISHIKSHSINPTIATQKAAEEPLMIDIYQAYEAEKRASKTLDFDDLLLEALHLFTKFPAFKHEFQMRVRHLLVDEYQDTNVVQHALLCEMARDTNKKLLIDSLCAVGDEDQSIYSWRGATVSNIINFKKDFPSTTSIKIEQNYRCVQPILELANKLITHNYNRNPKKLWSSKEGGNRIRLLNCMNEHQEADAIAHAIEKYRFKHAKRSVAVLYRTHAQSRALEEALIRRSIAYLIIGGVQFYERKEIKDIFAYLRLLHNPFDRTALFRIINCPLRGLGAKFEEQLHEYWIEHEELSFKQLLEKQIEDKIITGSKKITVEQFLAIFDDLSGQHLPSKAIEQMVVRTNYFTHLKASYDEQDAQSRIDNVKELLHAALHFEKTGINTVEKLLDEVALMQEKVQEDNQSEQVPVLLMTIHAAKGLEFDMVAISGLEEGLFPSTRSLHDTDSLEEERRLLYVAITRAKEHLLLTTARYRYTYGQTIEQSNSRFIAEFPKDLVRPEEVFYWNNLQFRECFADWFGITISKAPVFTFGNAAAFAASTSAAKTATTKSSVKPATPAKKVVRAAHATTSASTPVRNEQTTPAPDAPWKKNQLVHHAIFGAGLITAVEEKGANSFYLTVSFKAGTKKIDASFIKAA